jgi:hypothetical protein
MNNICHYIRANNNLLPHYTYFKQELSENDDYYIGGNVSINNHIIQSLKSSFNNDINIIDTNDEIGLVSFYYKNRYGYICEVKNAWFINLGGVIY